MVDDRVWFREFNKATEGVDVYSTAFLRKAQLGFQKFMYLLAKWPVKMDRIGFSPCPPIDLMWHTYLLQPKEYAIFSKKLILRVVHHKLLPKESRTLMTYSLRHDKEEKLWTKEFNESMAIYVNAPTRQEEEREKEVFYVCNACEMRIDLKRYHCEECTDFDLCEECVEKSTETRTHTKSHGLICYNSWGGIVEDDEDKKNTK